MTVNHEEGIYLNYFLILAQGKRMIVPKGCFVTKYRITVPRDRYEEGATPRDERALRPGSMLPI